MISRPYKAYGGVVQLTPKQAACEKEVLSSPRFAKVEWPLSLLARAYATRKTGMAGNATDKDWSDRNRLMAECLARKDPLSESKAQGDFTFRGLDQLGIPLPWLVAGALGLIVVVLLVSRK